MIGLEAFMEPLINIVLDYVTLNYAGACVTDKNLALWSHIEVTSFKMIYIHYWSVASAHRKLTFLPHVFNRPGLAGAVLQSPPSLTD